LPRTLATGRRTDTASDESYRLRFWTRLRRAQGGEDEDADAPLPPRGYWHLVWRRFKGDRVAVASGILLALVLLACFAGEPIAERLLGHGPDDIFPMAADIDRGLLPAGPWSHVPAINGVATVTPQTPRTLFILGADGSLGRDLFLRVLDGGRTTLELALGATFIALSLGLVLGLLSGYFGGWLDAIVQRLTELIMGFPILLFLIAFGFTAAQRLNSVTFGGVLAPGVLTLMLVIGIFSSFYPGRLVRSQVLSLREQEFVEAARMIGASDIRIMRKHLLPYVSGTLIVYATQLMAVTVFLEAGISILGVGIALPAATWGNLISANYGTLLAPGGPHASAETAFIHTTYLITLWPSLLLFVTVVAATLFGEGIRNAVDPQARRT
jgi:peptide/nickel transport system permease protein